MFVNVNKNFYNIASKLSCSLPKKKVILFFEHSIPTLWNWTPVTEETLT